MKLYTSSWFTDLPAHIARIGISRGVPRGQSDYRMYRSLAPGPWFNSASVLEYHDRYFDILRALDPETVLARLEQLACDHEAAALLCFEPPTSHSQWCHRGFVSAWFKDELDLNIPEWGQPREGSGWSHPKIPHPFRVLPASSQQDLFASK